MSLLDSNGHSIYRLSHKTNNRTHHAQEHNMDYRLSHTCTIFITQSIAQNVGSNSFFLAMPSALFFTCPAIYLLDNQSAHTCQPPDTRETSVRPYGLYITCPAWHAASGPLKAPPAWPAVPCRVAVAHRRPDLLEVAVGNWNRTAATTLEGHWFVLP